MFVCSCVCVSVGLPYFCASEMSLSKSEPLGPGKLSRVNTSVSYSDKTYRLFCNDSIHNIIKKTFKDSMDTTNCWFV